MFMLLKILACLVLYVRRGGEFNWIQIVVLRQLVIMRKILAMDNILYFFLSQNSVFLTMASLRGNHKHAK